MTTAAVIAGALLLLAAAAVVAMAVSRHTALRARVGSFPCALVHEGAAVGATVTGVAQYATGRLLWWRTRSLSLRPARVFVRSELVVLRREETGETDASGDAVLRLECGHRGEQVTLQVSRAAASGLVSWLEAAPRTVGRVV